MNGESLMPNIDFETRVKMLEGLGIEFVLEQEWRPEKPPREPHDLDIFRSVLLPLTAEEWCELCMREGSAYMGGCCGTMSYMQDTVSSWFRFESGWVEVRELAEVAEDFISHGDEDWWNKSEDDIVDAKTKWKSIDIWDKISIVWAIVKDYYSPRKLAAPRQDKPHPEEAVHLLSSALYSMSWDHITDGGIEKASSQAQGNYIFKLTKVLPAIKILYEQIEELNIGPLEGFALIEKDKGEDAICTNRLGYCIYKTMDEVQNILDLWEQQRAEYESPERDNSVKKLVQDEYVVRPVKISLENGIEFTDKEKLSG